MVNAKVATQKIKMLMLFIVDAFDLDEVLMNVPKCGLNLNPQSNCSSLTFRRFRKKLFLSKQFLGLVRRSAQLINSTKPICNL